MIPVTDHISLEDSEIEESFLAGSGPGGQNVNKVATAVQLRFDAGASPSLPSAVKERLRRVAGRKMTDAGVVVITANRFRTQERNRADAIERLVEMIALATHIAHRVRRPRPSPPAPRRSAASTPKEAPRPSVKSLRVDRGSTSRCPGL